MPPRKGVGKKKKEKQKAIQLKKISDARDRGESLIASFGSLMNCPCNTLMTCDQCGSVQKNRAFCYFCHAMQKLPQCAHCGKFKCLGQGDCIIKHGNAHVTGLKFVGSVCDYCEAWICHSRTCLTNHGCMCPFREWTEEGFMPVKCEECHRTVWQHGGRMYLCHNCEKWLCEDDHFEHEAMCQTLEGDSDKCISCGKRGQWACLRCKISYCDIHVNQLKKLNKNDPYRCKKCQYELKDVSNLSLSYRKHDFGRQQRSTQVDDDAEAYERYKARQDALEDDEDYNNMGYYDSDNDQQDYYDYPDDDDDNNDDDDDDDDEEEEQEEN